MSKKTLDEIVSRGNHYIVKVKANQPKLMAQIEEQTRQHKPIKRYESQEKTRDRHSTRIVEVFAAPKNLEQKWQSAGCVIKVERFGTRGERNYERVGYYLSSLSPKSKGLVAGIRGHWSIENRLHWLCGCDF